MQTCINPQGKFNAMQQVQLIYMSIIYTNLYVSTHSQTGIIKIVRRYFLLNIAQCKAFDEEQSELI